MPNSSLSTVRARTELKVSKDQLYIESEVPGPKDANSILESLVSHEDQFACDTLTLLFNLAA